MNIVTQKEDNKEGEIITPQLNTASDQIYESNNDEDSPDLVTTVMPQFENLHYPWLYKLVDQNFERFKEDLITFETYDSISCVTIEMQYQKYIQTKKSEKYRYCHFRVGSTIDFEKQVEIKYE